MTYRAGPKGQVVLPKRIREHLGIRPVDEVTVEQDEGAIRTRKAASVDDLWGSLRGGDLLAQHEAEHRRELEREDRRLPTLGS